MSDPTREETLAFARDLLDHGVPVIVCKPNAKGDEVVPVVAWRNIETSEQCRDMLDRFEYGTDALALIGGHGIDLVDVDTKAGGTIEPFGEFERFGLTRTPSGGWHYVVASTGRRRKQGLSVDGAPVGDYIGGTPDYGSRMLGFLPGSVRPKYGDVMYGFEEPWDVEGAVCAAPDPAVVAVLDKVLGEEPEREVYVDDSPERDPSLGVHPYARAAIDAELRRLRDLPTPWATGSYWDNTTFEVACQLVRFANSGWTGYSLEQARRDLLTEAPSDDQWGEREHLQKWRQAEAAVGDEGRRDPNAPEDDFKEETVEPVRLSADVTNADDAYKWLVRSLGRPGTPLAGLFRRGADLVHTPREGEEGYVEPDADPKVANDGPAQIRRMTGLSLTACLANNVTVFKTTRLGTVPALYPREATALAADSPEYLREARPLAGVTHTPLVRRDGSVLGEPGYDDASGFLFLPDRGLALPGESPGLGLLLDDLLEGFRFQTDHDRANYLAALLTPLLRLLVPPPYPLYAIGAPQAGTGKSLLAWVLREVHGGVFRSEMSRDAAELRKQVTTILDATSAPVVTFDNMTGTLRSSTLDGLLSSAEWTDRLLGGNQNVTVPNDRLWTLTGNNLSLGGDLRRRTVWVTIDSQMEHPEERTDFKHRDLPGWVTGHRGGILAALLGLVSGWVAAGRPAGDAAERTDSYRAWQATVSGVLAHAGVPGTVNHAESVRREGLEDEDEWGTFLAAVEATFGDGRWQARQVIAAALWDDGLALDALPEAVVEKATRPGGGERVAAKSLGHWANFRANRWAGGRAVREAGKDRNGVRYWRVVTPETDLL